MSTPERKYTNAIYDLLEQGVLDPESVIDMCLKYLPEVEVHHMCWKNDLLELIDGLDDDEDDHQPSWEQEWEDFGEDGLESIEDI